MAVVGSPLRVLQLSIPLAQRENRYSLRWPVPMICGGREQAIVARASAFSATSFALLILPS
jgi:hypothetical protein